MEFPEDIRNFLDSADVWVVGDWKDECVNMLDPAELHRARRWVLISVCSSLEKAQELSKGKGYFIMPVKLDTAPVRQFFIC